MDLRAQQILTLNGQIRNLQIENGQLKARLMSQDIIQKFLMSALTGAASLSLSNEDVVTKAFAIADLAMQKLQAMGAKAPQTDPHTPDPQSPVSPLTV